MDAFGQIDPSVRRLPPYGCGRTADAHRFGHFAGSPWTTDNRRTQQNQQKWILAIFQPRSAENLLVGATSIRSHGEPTKLNAHIYFL